MMGQVILSLTAVGNGPCDPVSDGLVLRIWTGIANAGPDQMNVHGNYTTLQGNEPTFGNGLWQIVTGSGGNIDDPDNPVSGFHGVIDHTYSLTWTISNALCATSVDTVVIRFVPLWSCGEPIVDDRDGQSYNTALIGEQCWLAENMNIGTMIISSGPGQLQTDNGIFEKYCYDNIPVNCDIYGGLYEWREAMQYTTDRSPQGICPEGWHFASDAEWKTLEGTVDSQFGVGNPEWDDIGWRGDDAGANLKETGTVHWLSPNNATNMSGFTALGCGSRDEEGTFDYIQFLGMFHTSTQSGESTNITRGMRHDHTGVHRYDLYDVNAGRGVRCLKSE
jgi:uncharacterized protein (TIGR02145 family)